MKGSHQPDALPQGDRVLQTGGTRSRRAEIPRQTLLRAAAGLGLCIGSAITDCTPLHNDPETYSLRQAELCSELNWGVSDTEKRT